MDYAKLKSLLFVAKTIAIIGAKDVPGFAVDRCGRYLIDAGYQVVPVHQKRRGVWGLQTYANIREIPFTVDIINVFRADAHCLGHAIETLELPKLPFLFWMQSGIRNAQAKELLAQRGVTVVEDACLMVEHRAFFPFGVSVPRI